MTSIVTKKLFKAKTAVMNPPFQTSERLQHLDISVIEPVKHYTIDALDKTLIRMIRKTSGEYTLTGHDLWNCILHGCHLAMSARSCTSGFRKILLAASSSAYSLQD